MVSRRKTVSIGGDWGPEDCGSAAPGQSCQRNKTGSGPHRTPPPRLGSTPPLHPAHKRNTHPHFLRPRPSPWSAILSGLRPPAGLPCLPSPKILGCPSCWCWRLLSPSHRVPFCPQVPIHFSPVFPGATLAPHPHSLVLARSWRFPDGGWAAAVRTRRTGRRGKAGGGAQGGRGAPGNGPRPRHCL